MSQMFEMITSKKISKDEFDSLNHTPTMEQFVRNRIIIRYENDSDLHNKTLTRQVMNHLDQLVSRIWYRESMGCGLHRLHFLDEDYEMAKDFIRTTFYAENQKRLR